MKCSDRLLRIFVMMTGLLAGGCAFGPRTLVVSRTEYNRVLQETAKEEMLLNLVRLQYSEPPEFIDVPSITQQYTFGGDSSVGTHPMFPGSLSWLADASATETPTIAYAPLHEEEFNKRLVTPISLETLDLLTRTGWSIDRLFRLTVQTINDVDNATTACGPTPNLKPEFERFLALTNRLGQLQQSRQAEIAAASETDEPTQMSGPMPADQLTPEHVLEAASNGFQLRSSPDGRTVTLWKAPEETEGYALQFAPEVVGSPVMLEVAELANLVEIKPTYRIEFESEGHLKDRFQKKDHLVVSTRSILEAMYYLSQGIEVPREHYECGLVRLTFDESGQWFDWTRLTGDLLRIRSQKKRPKDAAIAVQHQDYWFYIEDTDLVSKATLSLLLEVYNLEIRGGGGRQVPLLTIGAGGRRR